MNLWQELDLHDADLDGHDEAPLHRALAAANARRFRRSAPSDDWPLLVKEGAALQLIEGTFVERERQRVEAYAAEAPREAEAFATWLARLRTYGPGQSDPFLEWLADTASCEQLRWVVTQEGACERDDVDLPAMTRLALPAAAKVALATEPAAGRDERARGEDLAVVACRLGVAAVADTDLVWEVLARRNLMVALAMNRRYAYHALGAQGAAMVAAASLRRGVWTALRRLRLAPGAVGASGGSAPSRAAAEVRGAPSPWPAQQLVAALAAEEPMSARYLAEGALMRLRAGARCLSRYRSELCIGGLDLS